MKTLLYNPIFVNPQAYYVFPNLSRVQTQEVDSTKEPANYIGTIEVKTIAYGDTNKVQTFTSTSEIDLVNFSNEWVRISLYTILGSVVLGEWKLGNFEQEEPEEPPYIEPDVLASLCGVWIADQNTNESPTRDTIKNKLKDKGGDFKILNAAYKDNSGYGLYKEDFSSRWYLYEGVNASHNRISLTDSALKNTLWIANRYNDIKDSYYVNITGIPKNGTLVITSPWTILYNGLNKIETSGIESETLGFRIAEESINLDWSKLVIEQIPEYQGAFIADGVDDLIVSEKSTPEILTESNEVTVVTMAVNLQHVGDKRNNFLSSISSYLETVLTETAVDKYSISGYTTTDYASAVNHKNINPILGDKQDYILRSAADSSTRLFNRFGVNGYVAGSAYKVSNVAWYWTFIANKVLTEDQINQVIEYFNLDKYVKPDVLYNVKKQGITNDNHTQFGDKLIDYSGNGRDMQLYNIGWRLDSGIGKYTIDFTSWEKIGSVITSANRFIYNYNSSHYPVAYLKKSFDYIPSFKVSVILKKGRLAYVYVNDSGENVRFYIDRSGTYILPASYNTNTDKNWVLGFLAIIDKDNKVEGTVTQIPEYEGALILDGVNDYGKVDNMPIYKDYTVVVDREILSSGIAGCVASKNNPGAFLMELGTGGANIMSNYSFGAVTSKRVYNKRHFSYQSKYLYNEEAINVGTDNDTSDMWLGTVRDGDNRFSNLVMRSLMCFPYSLSKFLINRQISNNKLFDDNVVELLPVLDINEYKYVRYYNEAQDVQLYYGDYIPKGSTIAIKILMQEHYIVDSATCNGEECEVWDTPTKDLYYIICKNIRKYPQMIKVKTSKYINYEEIIQPYPAYLNFVRLIDDGEEIREIPIKYGHTLADGTKIKVKTITNLLPAMYHIVKYIYNGETLNYKQLTSREFIVQGEDKLEFGVITNYLLDNEPKCILSPEKLKMPNSVYEKLGYIPDISGHGNHGYIYNSAYNELNSGMNSDGSFKLDGVNDYIKLDTLSTGGQQVLMKCKWSKAPTLLYDQRNSNFSGFAVLTTLENDNINPRLAYNGRNLNGDTYIDGTKNKHIETYNLQDIIHNIVVTNDKNIISSTPIIGAGNNNASHSKMSLYTFVLFNEISSPEKIKELNDIIGIDNSKYDVAPPYYYDTYGKTNNTPDRNVLINMGTDGSHDLNLLNFGFNGEDGYCDVTFDGPWNVVTVNRDIYDNKVIIYDLDSVYDHSVNQYNDFIWGKWLTQYNNPKPSNDTPSFYARFNGIPQGGSIAYLYVKEDGTIDKKIMNENYVYYLLPASYNTRYVEKPDALQAAKMGFIAINPWEETSPLVIEVCKGLILDGVNDTLRNTTIPALTDFTCIVKREAIGEQANNSIFMFKGATPTAGGKSNAFLYDYKSAGINNVFSFGQANGGATDVPISYLTKTQCDGRTITAGDGTDAKGLMIGKWDTWWKGAFYKMLLWNKTLNNLTINMMKNLIEEDNIIDINSPIFKEPEGGAKNLNLNLSQKLQP